MGSRAARAARGSGEGLDLLSLARRLREANDTVGRRLGIRLVRSADLGVHINAEWVERFRYFDRLADRVEEVEGSVVECGVAAGQSLAMFASLFRSRGWEGTIWGFDTFSGLPAPGREDLASRESVARAGMFSWARERSVLAELRGHGFDDDWIGEHVRLVKGTFSETLSSYDGGPIALLHVDADLYESYTAALRTLWPQLAVGGVAAFDEYADVETWPGARRAVDEFLGGLLPGSASLGMDDETGKAFAVKLRP